MSVHMLDQARHNVTALPHATPPSFEGHEVTSARAKLTAVANLDIDSDFQIDQVVRVTVEGVVTAVGHIVDARGCLVRVHTIKVLDVCDAAQEG